VGALALALSALAILAGPASAFAAGSISGLVTDGTDPVPGVEVCASEVPGEEEEFGCAETNSSGEYTIAGLVAGKYKVEFWPPESVNLIPQYFDAKSSWALADQVTVTNGNDTPNVNAVLEEGGWIEGRIFDSVSEAGVPDIRVCASPLGHTGFDRCMITGSSGNYKLLGLRTDSYMVGFVPKEGGGSLDYVWQFYKEKDSWFEPTPVEVSAGSGTSGIDAAMEREGHIAGTVTDAASGAPIPFARVCLFELKENYEPWCTDADWVGHYVFDGLSGGGYKVWFSPDGLEWLEEDDYFQQFYNDKPTLALADTVHVSAGTTTSGIDAHLVSRHPAPAKPLVATPAIPVLAEKKPKPVHCHKGQRKVRKKGKLRCVKTHRRRGRR
jgi:hypothetical protein